MNKRAIIVSICLSLAITLIAPFHLVKAEWDQTGTGTVYYTQSKYTIPLNYDINGLVETTTYGTLTSNEYQGLPTTSSLNNNIDDNYELFVMVNVNYFVTAESCYNAGRTNLACVSYDGLAQVNSQAVFSGGSTQLVNILNAIGNLVIGDNITLSAVSFGTLYNLGYRFADVKYISDLGKYIYILAKYRTPDVTNYSGYTTTANSADQKTLYLERFDINLDSFYYNYTGDWDYIQVVFITGCDLVYASNDVNIYYSSYDSTTGDYYYVVNIVNNRNIEPSVTFAKILYNYDIRAQITKNTISCKIFDDPGMSGSDYSTQLNTINNNLVLIQDLISDIQVQEINNIYNDITNNYNIDIDTEINNYIGDLHTNLNQFHTVDNLTNNNKNVIGRLATVAMDTFDILDENNLEIIYILPLALIILGAVIL